LTETSVDHTAPSGVWTQALTQADQLTHCQIDQ